MRRLVIKQPAETFYIGVDFSPVLAEGEGLDQINSEIVAYDSTGQDVSTEILVNDTMMISDTVLQIKVQGGEVGQRYKVSFRAATNFGNLYEEDIWLLIRD